MAIIAYVWPTTLQEALEAERARLESVLDQLPVAVWIADSVARVIKTNSAVERRNLAVEHFREGAITATQDEQVIYWNPAAQRMHGFRTADKGIEPLEETPLTFDLLIPQDRRLLTLKEWPMRRIERGETVQDLELVLRRPDQGWE